MKKLLDLEGPVFGFLEKTGQLITLSVLWLLGCLPVITLCTSCAALYHAVTDSVRFAQEPTVKTFARGFRDNLLPGIVISILLVGALVILEAASVFLLGSVMPTGFVLVLMILDLFVLLYVGPVLDRFRLGVKKTLKLSFVMSLQYAHYSLVFLLGVLVLVVLQMYIFPMAVILLLPGAGCLAMSFLMEKVLHHYTRPEDEEKRA